MHHARLSATEFGGAPHPGAPAGLPMLMKPETWELTTLVLLVVVLVWWWSLSQSHPVHQQMVYRKQVVLKSLPLFAL